MTHQEYLKFLQGSQFFQGLGKEMQKIVLSAKGSQKEQYIEIFTGAENNLQEAKKEFIRKNSEAVSGFLIKVKSIKKAKRKHDEKKSIREDEEREKALLGELQKF
jgi:hypothetical protein